MKKWIMATPPFLVGAIAALPVLTCPACWPLYAGLLSALGLGFTDYAPFLFPLTILLLLASLFSLLWKAKQRQGYRPFILGLGATILILGGRFYLEINAVYYAGLVFLITASLWNIWPKLKAE